MRLELDEYAYLDSPIHRWDASAKLIGLLAIITSFAFVEQLQHVPAMLGVTVVVYALSRLPVSFLTARLRYPGIFILGVVGLLPFLSGSTVLWSWGFLSLRQEGVMATALVMGRFFSILTLGLVLFGTTPFIAQVRAMRSLGLPGILADMLLLTYRYLFVLLEMLTTMRRAMRLRGFSFHPSRFNLQDLQRLASLMGTLFIRSYEQSQRIYTAMRLRGYGALPQQRITPVAQRRTGDGLWHRAGLMLSLLIAAGFLITDGLWNGVVQ